MKCNLPKQDGKIAKQKEQPKVKADTSQLQTSRPETISSNTQQQGENMPPQPKPKAQPIRVEKKVGRNDVCPCGSGKKYKQCHGKLV